MVNDESQRVSVDGVPVLWVPPVAGSAGAPVALWLPGLSQTKQDTLPVLRALAGAGYLAVSFDPWQHGERGTESGGQIITRVFGDLRRHLWPILGHTTLDALRVLDWVIGELGAGPRVVAGGVSMGGDVAVALGGIDRRVERVGAVVATPDWARPGMRDVNNPAIVLPQGVADAYAQWFYDRLDPLTHLDAYAEGPAIAFECGADDAHIPADGALRFQAALAQRHPSTRDRVRVTVHPGLGHISGAQHPAPLRNCLTWLTT